MNFKKLKINKLLLFVLGVSNFMVDLLTFLNINNASIAPSRNVKHATLKKMFKKKEECTLSTSQAASKI